MSRLIPHGDMTADELIQCSYQARAILHLVDIAAWSIQSDSSAVGILADSIGSATRLALELLEPVHDALESRKGLKGGTI